MKTQTFYLYKTDRFGGQCTMKLEFSPATNLTEWTQTMELASYTLRGPERKRSIYRASIGSEMDVVDTNPPEAVMEAYTRLNYLQISAEAYQNKRAEILRFIETTY